MVSVGGFSERDALKAVLDPEAELCPRCGARPVPKGSTSGFCPVCHYRALGEAQRLKDETDAARREYHKQRQRALRARKERKGSNDGDA